MDTNLDLDTMGGPSRLSALVNTDTASGMFLVRLQIPSQPPSTDDSSISSDESDASDAMSVNSDDDVPPDEEQPLEPEAFSDATQPTAIVAALSHPTMTVMNSHLGSFSRLPYELRLLIWEYAAYDFTKIHSTLAMSEKGRISHVIEPGTRYIARNINSKAWHVEPLNGTPAITIAHDCLGLMLASKELQKEFVPVRDAVKTHSMTISLDEVGWIYQQYWAKTWLDRTHHDPAREEGRALFFPPTAERVCLTVMLAEYTAKTWMQWAPAVGGKMDMIDFPSFFKWLSKCIKDCPKLKELSIELIVHPEEKEFQEDMDLDKAIRIMVHDIKASQSIEEFSVVSSTNIDVGYWAKRNADNAWPDPNNKAYLLMNRQDIGIPVFLADVSAAVENGNFSSEYPRWLRFVKDTRMNRLIKRMEKRERDAAVGKGWSDGIDVDTNMSSGA